MESKNCIPFKVLYNNKFNILLQKVIPFKVMGLQIALIILTEIIRVKNF